MIAKLALRGVAAMILTAAAWAEPVKKGTVYALVVGVDQVAASSKGMMHDLPFSSKDATRIKEALVNLCKASPQQVELLSDNGTPASRAAVLTSLDRICSLAGPQDTVVFFFTGHGIEDEKTGLHYLMLSGADPMNLDATCLSTNKLQTNLRRTNATNLIVIIDACRQPVPVENGRVLLASKGLDLSGVGGFHLNSSTGVVSLGDRVAYDFKMSKGWRESLSEAAEPGKTLYTLWSCRPGEFSYTAPDLDSGGYFTHYFLKGLQGGASREDGLVTINSMMEYLRANVPAAAEKASSKDNPSSQHPMLDTKSDGGNQDLILGSLQASAPNKGKPAEAAQVVAPPEPARPTTNLAPVVQAENKSATQNTSSALPQVVKPADQTSKVLPNQVAISNVQKVEAEPAQFEGAELSVMASGRIANTVNVKLRLKIVKRGLLSVNFEIAYPDGRKKQIGIKSVSALPGYKVIEAFEETEKLGLLDSQGNVLPFSVIAVIEGADKPVEVKTSFVPVTR